MINHLMQSAFLRDRNSGTHDILNSIENTFGFFFLQQGSHSDNNFHCFLWHLSLKRPNSIIGKDIENKN